MRPPPSRKNAGEFDHKGLEIEASYVPTKEMSIDLSYSYLNMDTAKLAAPEHQLFTGINYSLNKLAFVVQANYIGGLYTSTSYGGVYAGDQRRLLFIECKFELST